MELTQPVPVPRRTQAVRVAGATVVALIAACVWAASRAPTAAPVATAPLAQSVPSDRLPPGPPDEAWARAVAALAVDRHPGAVVAKLRELNPGFDGQVSRLGFSDGKVTEFGILTDAVADIRPIRVFAGLRTLTAVGTSPGKGKLVDLTPIRGLPLTTLNVWQNPNLADLAPARGMPLTMLQAGDTAIEDLTSLAGAPLDLLAVNNCRVKSLAPVRTMPRIRYLRCDGCPLDGIAPLTGSRVRELQFTPVPDRNDGHTLDQLPQLTRINGFPANEFRRRISAPH